MNTKLLKVSFPPFLKSEETTRTLMSDVLIALLPSLIWAVYIFGNRVLTITAVSVISNVIFEFAFCKITRRKTCVGDLSACVSGIIFAFILPPAVPLWIVIAGAFISTVIVKGMFGGLGRNILNPALSAKVILLIVFPKIMTAYTAPFYELPAFKFGSFDVFAVNTSLSYLKSGVFSKDTLFDLVIGNCAGCIGEVSVLLLAAGGLYLLVRRIITYHIPLLYIGTVALLTYLFPLNDMPIEFMMSELFSGSLILGAFFLACDFSSSPVTASGRIIYGIGCGILTVVFRYYGYYIEGVPFAILIMNVFSRYLDLLIIPKRFGILKKSKAGRTEQLPAEQTNEAEKENISEDIKEVVPESENENISEDILEENTSESVDEDMSRKEDAGGTAEEEKTSDVTNNTEVE